MRRLGPALGLLLLATTAAAQDGVRAEVDARKIGLQDLLQLTVTVEGSAGGSIGSVPTPALTHLRVAGEPSVAQQVSVINGQMSQSRTFTFLLQPTQVGTATIGPIQLDLGGQPQTTEAITIEVVPGSIRQQAQPRSRRLDPLDDLFGEDPLESFLGRRATPRAEPKLFVQAQASRQKLYVGEALLLTYWLYTQTAVTDIQLADGPQYPGFWPERIEEKGRGPAPEVVVVEGERYQRVVFLRQLLFPTKAGSLTVPPATFRIGIPRLSFFDAGSAIDRSTQAVTVEALPVPEEPGLSGAVGQFDVSASVDRNQIPLGEAVTLRFEVKGVGNLKWVEAPPEVKMASAEIYPPQTKSNLTVSPSGMSGSKIWEFVVVPATGGSLEIPGIDFGYFDPKVGRVVHRVTAPIPLQVEGAVQTAAVPVAPLSQGVARSGTLPLRSDIDPASVRVPVLSARAVGLGLGLMLLLHAGVWGGAVFADRRRRSAGRAAPRPSVRRALAELSRAGRDSKSKEASAATIEKTLHDVFGSLDAGADDERARAAREVLREVEFLRYAPQLGDYTEKIREVASKAAEVVRRWA